MSETWGTIHPEARFFSRTSTQELASPTKVQSIRASLLFPSSGYDSAVTFSEMTWGSPSENCNPCPQLQLSHPRAPICPHPPPHPSFSPHYHFLTIIHFTCLLFVSSHLKPSHKTSLAAYLENPVDRRAWRAAVGSHRVRHDWVTNTCLKTSSIGARIFAWIFSYSICRPRTFLLHSRYSGSIGLMLTAKRWVGEPDPLGWYC